MGIWLQKLLGTLSELSDRLMLLHSSELRLASLKLGQSIAKYI